MNGCCGINLSWYPVYQKIACYKYKYWRFFVDFLHIKLSIFVNVCLPVFVILVIRKFRKGLVFELGLQRIYSDTVGLIEYHRASWYTTLDYNDES